MDGERVRWNGMELVDGLMIDLAGLDDFYKYQRHVCSAAHQFSLCEVNRD